MYRENYTLKEKNTLNEEGVVLQEIKMGTITFKFLGINFSSNKNRVKPYKFKSTWKPYNKQGFLQKCKMILLKQVEVI